MVSNKINVYLALSILFWLQIILALAISDTLKIQLTLKTALNAIKVAYHAKILQQIVYHAHKTHIY